MQAGGQGFDSLILHEEVENPSSRRALTERGGERKPVIRRGGVRGANPPARGEKETIDILKRVEKEIRERRQSAMPGGERKRKQGRTVDT